MYKTMFAMLSLLIILGFFFPKPVGRFLDGVVSLGGKIISPAILGVFKILGAILQAIVTLIEKILKGLFLIIIRLFRALFSRH